MPVLAETCPRGSHAALGIVVFREVIMAKIKLIKTAVETARQSEHHTGREEGAAICGQDVFGIAFGCLGESIAVGCFGRGTL